MLFSVFRQEPTAFSVNNIKLADLATLAVLYRRLLIKLHTSNNHIWFNSRCKKLKVLPNYTNIKSNTKSLEGRRAIFLARCSWRDNVLRDWYATRDNLSLHLKVVHTELLSRLHIIEFQWYDRKVREETAELSHMQYLRQKAKLDKLCNPSNLKQHRSQAEDVQFHPRFRNLTAVSFNNSEIELMSKGINYSPPVNINMTSFENLAVDAEAALYKESIQLKSTCALQIKKGIKDNSSSTNNFPFFRTISSVKKKLRDFDLIACKADKGNTITILSGADYLSKVNDFISVSSAVELKKDPTSSFKKSVSVCINSCKKIFGSDGWKYSVMNPSSPILYGLPKIHKEGIPIRPIVSYCNAPAYRLCKGFISFFNQYTSFHSSFSVKNSVQLVSKLQKLTIPLHSKLISFDVVSLFTSIPVGILSEIVMSYLDRDVLDIPLRDELKLIFNTCIKQNYFYFNNKFYKFSDGLPMGSPLSPLLAEIFMNFFEQKILSSSNPFYRHIICWHRYVDDILCIWNGTDRLLNSFLLWLNSQYPSIDFTLEIETNLSLNFLDVTITRINSTLDFSIYRKPTYTDAIIPFSSNHPFNIKMSAFHSFIDRLINIPMSNSNFNRELGIILKIATNNGYRTDTIIKLLNKKIKRRTINTIYPSDHTTTSRIWRRLEYIGKTSQKLSNIVSRFSDINFAFYNKSTIKKLIFNNIPKTDVYSKSGVYQLNCNNCSFSYIGQTGRNFKIRANEHLAGLKESTFHNHLFSENHSASIDNLDVLHVQNKGRRLDTLESYEIRKAIYLNRDILNEQREVRFSPLTDPSLFYNRPSV